MQIKFNAQGYRYNCGHIEAVLRDKGIPNPLAWQERDRDYVVVEAPMGTPTKTISDAVDRCLMY